MVSRMFLPGRGGCDKATVYSTCSQGPISSLGTWLLYIVSQKVETRVKVAGLSAALSLVNRSWASIDVKFRATDPCSIFFYPE